MAQSFWSKRKSTISNAGGYIKAADSVSRPTAILLTVLGIVIIGGLLFGIFAGTRWAYTQLTGKNRDTTITQGNDTKGPSITATSSTSTSSPSATTTTTLASNPAPTPAPTTAPTVVAATQPTTNKLPKTGAGSNSLFFLGMTVIGYILYRRHSLKS
jgi:LPXTG-motif cell wall-anchored protein